MTKKPSTLPPKVNESDGGPALTLTYTTPTFTASEKFKNASDVRSFLDLARHNYTITEFSVTRGEDDDITLEFQ